MAWLLSLNNIVYAIFLVFSGIINFILWKRAGFNIPKYIHVIAFVSGCIGVLLAYLAFLTGTENGHKAIWLVVGFPVAIYFIFGCFAENEDRTFARKMRAFAEQGDAKAQYNLGLMYSEGVGVKLNYSEARKW